MWEALTVFFALGWPIGGVSLLVLWMRWRAAQKQHAADQQLLDGMQVSLQAMKVEVETLSPYRSIVDAKAEAKQIREQAKLMATELQAAGQKDAQQARDNADLYSREVRSKADSYAHNIRHTADTEATQTKGIAERIAQEFRQDAEKARRETDRLERALQAVKNTLDGYGDRYLLPTQGLLDELGDAYGYAEAGQELKKARDYSRLLVNSKKAAACDYAEEFRKDIAIRFVLDAFNGKVDSILTEIKSENHGTLTKKIQDAYALVNMHGSAFRNAHVLPEYLEARLNEMKWAVRVVALREKEREEQRRIKEQLREEERARKELEQAVKDTEKEEQVIAKAMEKAQAQLEKATAAQRERYEAQLAELAEKLKAAEEKNKRALSMAQQTRSGYVYVISNIGSFGDGVFKIGMTRRLEPMDRVKELGDASVPFGFDVHALIYTNDAPKLEKELHRRFVLQQVNKLNPRKEFFRVPLKEVRSTLEGLGVNAVWTMAAEAAEYRESLAIERANNENYKAKEAWLKKQFAFDPGTELFEGE